MDLDGGVEDRAAVETRRLHAALCVRFAPAMSVRRSVK